MPIETPWTTNYPTTQDTGVDGATQQPTLVDDSIPGALDGDRFLVSQILTLRKKIHAACLKLGDDTRLPIGSVAAILDLNSGEAKQLRLFQRTTAPTNVATKGFLYVKDVGAGAVELFYVDAAGNEVQITDGGNVIGGPDANAVHINLPGEIAGIVSEKTAPIAGDLMIIEDSADINNKKKVQLSNVGKAIKLDDLAAPDDNTDRNATTGQHGLLPKLGGGTTNYLRADGTWAEPPGGGTDPDAIHTNVAGEIASIPAVTIVNGASLLVMEDLNDEPPTFAKKRISIATLRTNCDAIYLWGNMLGPAMETPTAGDVIQWDGDTWEPTAIGALLNKFDATAAPTANDDNTDGYAVGSRWINITTDKGYECVDASTGAAIWIETTWTSVLNKYDATVAPTVSNDNTQGYAVGSRWVDITADKGYECVDASTGAAVWLETTGGGSTGPLNKFDATVAPAATDDNTEGYAVGSRWIDVTADKTYECVDATTDAAIWLSAIHVNASDEIIGITETTDPSADAVLVLEDAGEGSVYEKYRATVETLRTNANAGRIQGGDISATPPADGDILVWHGSPTSQWQPEAPSGGGSLDRMLLFSDDTEFSEATGTFVTKKTFRVIQESVKRPTSYRLVLTLWCADGATQAEAQLVVGTATAVTVTSAETAETDVAIKTITVTAVAGDDDKRSTVAIKCRVSGGTGTAHLKYTDLYAIFA
jgi:hypothetical protein